MRGSAVWLAALLTFGAMTPGWVGAAEAEVDLELITESPLAAQGSHQWIDALRELGFTTIRIRAARGTDELKIDDYGSKEQPRYRVIGRVASRQELKLPGGAFSVRDLKGLKKWLTELKNEGPAGVLEARTPLGLTGKQLTDVSKDLEQPLDFSTKDQPADQIVKRIGDKLAYPLVLAKGADQELAVEDARVRDELKGLSAGTALAAALRPAGLALRPKRIQGRTEYHVEPAGDGANGWPIGWPLQNSPLETYKALFDMLNVELDDIPLAEAVEAVQTRLKVPVLYDHNALVRFDIDPATFKVTLPAQRTAYDLLLRKALAKAQLRHELRLDEAGKPLIWITTQRPLPAPKAADKQ